MTANLMPVRGHVPTKIELQYTMIDCDANQTTKMRSCFGGYHDALEIIFGLYDLLLELCSLQKSNPNRAMKLTMYINNDSVLQNSVPNIYKVDNGLLML